MKEIRMTPRAIWFDGDATVMSDDNTEETSLSDGTKCEVTYCHNFVTVYHRCGKVLQAIENDLHPMEV